MLRRHHNGDLPKAPVKVSHSLTVTYDSRNHLSIITQAWGSDWRRIVPYCVVNTLIMAALHVLFAYGIDLQISGQGHSFMSLVVAFLLVSRVSTSLDRYSKARDALETLNQHCRTLIQTAVVYSNADLSHAGKQWRQDVAYRTLLLLRTSMAVIDYPSSGVAALELGELSGEVLDDLRKSVPETRWLHESRSNFEENLRVPIRMAYLLRKTIRTQESILQPPIPIIPEGDLYACVNGMMDGYYGLQKLLTTPVPFPLIQMTTTFLFFYLFTVPFALLSDNETLIDAISHCIVIFLLTYGFMGMQFVSIDFDDPFGDEANDFNNLALAQMAFEDAYATIADVDGMVWADSLRFMMHGDAETPMPSERSWLLGGSALDRVV